MRIQHNIMAMNAYRNYNNNTSALSKNLEKLSSGYKINRAGDDAAGLAISEKMRAQISGLEAATKNVKDGISLVKTAEGAMQEVQDMLNRMDYLATQSANGTYDEEVDRMNLQKEVSALASEIDRIADSANFNGIQLMDGSLGTSKVLSGDLTEADLAASENLTTSSVAAVAGKYDVTMAGLKDILKADGDKASVTLTTSEGDVTFDIEVTDIANKEIEISVNGGDAKSYTITDTDDDGFASAINNAFSADSSVEGLTSAVVASSGGKLTFTAEDEGTTGATVTAASYTYEKADGTTGQGTFAAAVRTAAADKKVGIADAQFKEYDDSTEDDIADTTYEINGKKFVIVQDASDAKDVADDVNVIIGDPTADQESIAAQLSRLTGLNVSRNTAGDGYVFATASDGTATKSEGGLTLQIGDTADEYNQLKVSIGDMHSEALGISDVDISTQEGAAEAIQKIKDAINSVSSTRGDLGAIQNRLEHTQNNLSVMTENITDAESTIRDTDVADEMMAYTKNNILIQSAQAMLAQANAVPQGVLQLLQ